ncbi:MAG: hypothetical protein FWC68_01380 [Oscillospiraceae bacterium]|nr:hypothetical protein [Oscillospiraceae bacterium]
MATIVRNFEIGSIHMPATDHPTAAVRNFLLAMQENNLQYELVEIGDRIVLGDAVCEILFVDNSMPANLNATCIVIRMTYGDQSFLFMADAESGIEYALEWERATVLRTGHHGSHTSSTENFLRQAVPEVAIISVGVNNIYEHPRREVLDRLENVGARTYRTDEHGTIWLASDGTRSTITFLRGE